MNSRQYLRDKQTGLVSRGISWSDTAGDSFSAAFYPPSLPDPIVEGAMTTDLAAKMLVFTHPANPHNRDHESVFSSIDGGVTWEAAVLLDANYSSYSSIVALSNGSFAVQWDTGVTHMHRCITPPKLPSGSFVGCGATFAIVTFDAAAPAPASGHRLSDDIRKLFARIALTDGAPPPPPGMGAGSAGTGPSGPEPLCLAAVSIALLLASLGLRSRIHSSEGSSSSWMSVRSPPCGRTLSTRKRQPGGSSTSSSEAMRE